MILIFLVPVIGIWLFIAISLGTRIPKWLGVTRYQAASKVAVVALIFVAPVADEIIAYPQFRALCKTSKLYELAPGMDEKSAHGRTVYYAQIRTTELLWPPTVKVSRLDLYYLDSSTREPVLHSRGFNATQGLLAAPAGSSGDKMAVLLGGCGSRIEPYDSMGLSARFGRLNLKKVASP